MIANRDKIRSTSISVVVPVYNSERSLPELVMRLEKTLSRISHAYEIVFVNDGSHDRSWEVICKCSDANEHVRGIDLMRNYGQHNALLCGIREARFDTIITMDDDLQHPPEEIPALIEKLNTGYSVVYGTPKKGQHDMWRVIASRITRLALSTVMGAKTAQQVSPFRAINAKVREAFLGYKGSFVSIDVLLTWGSNRFGSVMVKHDVRREGKSNYTFRNLVILALNMMTGFSALPLQFATIIGFTFSFFGLLVLISVITRYFITGINVPGFAFLSSIIAIFSGAQLLAIGIIGEYLARMHFRIIDKPSYCIRIVAEGKTEVNINAVSLSDNNKNAL